MQIRCVSSSEIPLRSRRGPNEKSWMKNLFERQSQSSPSSGSFFSARWIEIRFQIRSDVVSQAVTGRRIYPRESALPAASSATLPESRDPSCCEISPFPAAYAVTVQSYVTLIYRRATCSREVQIWIRLASLTWRVVSWKLNKQKTTDAETIQDLIGMYFVTSRSASYHPK